jgi:hypothetical protein
MRYHLLDQGSTMTKYQIKIVGDVAASKFYHLRNYPLTTQCPYCHRTCRITQGARDEAIMETIQSLAGYARMGMCSNCHRTMVVGLRRAQKQKGAQASFPSEPRSID